MKSFGQIEHLSAASTIENHLFDAIDGSKYFVRPQYQQIDTLSQPARFNRFITDQSSVTIKAVDCNQLIDLATDCIGKSIDVEIDDLYRIARNLKRSIKSPIAIIDFNKRVVVNLNDALAAFVCGAKVIPAIVIEPIRSADLNKIVALPDQSKLVQGVVFGPDNQLIADLHECTSIDQINQLVCEQVQPDQSPTNSDVLNRFVAGLEQSSNQVVVDKSTVIVNPDIDNSIAIKLERGQTIVDRLISVSATFDLGLTTVTFANHVQLVSALTTFAITADVDQLVVDIAKARSYSQQVSIDPAAADMFVRMINNRFNVESVNRLGDQTVITIKSGQFAIVVTLNGNDVSFQLTGTDMYIGSITITDDNIQSIIERYRKSVDQINQQPTTVFQILTDLTKKYYERS